MTKGDRIKARREELGLTQTDLAEAMSKLMSQKRWEGGCSRWDIVLQLYGIDFGGGLFGSWFLPT